MRQLHFQRKATSWPCSLTLTFTMHFIQGDVMFAERKILGAQNADNQPLCRVCDQCMRFVGTCEDHLARLLSALSSTLPSDTESEHSQSTAASSGSSSVGMSAALKRKAAAAAQAGTAVDPVGSQYTHPLCRALASILGVRVEFMLLLSEFLSRSAIRTMRVFTVFVFTAFRNELPVLCWTSVLGWSTHLSRNDGYWVETQSDLSKFSNCVRFPTIPYIACKYRFFGPLIRCLALWRTQAPCQSCHSSRSRSPVWRERPCSAKAGVVPCTVVTSVALSRGCSTISFCAVATKSLGRSYRPFSIMPKVNRIAGVIVIVPSRVTHLNRSFHRHRLREREIYSCRQGYWYVRSHPCSLQCCPRASVVSSYAAIFDGSTHYAHHEDQEARVGSCSCTLPVRG